jgi:2-alkenal reductase
MAGLQGSRLTKVALTGVLTPALALGAAGAFGFGFLPGAAVPPAAAESVLASGTCTAFGAPVDAPASDMSVADVAAKLNPSVVTVMNLQTMSQSDLNGIQGIQGIQDIPGFPQMPNSGELPGSDTPSGQPQSDSPNNGDSLVPVGTGSGFIVDELGHVVTNAHVVDGAEKLDVVLADGTDVPATVIGAEPLIDVALLQLNLPAGAQVPGIAPFGDSDSLRAGDEVVAIGNALGEFPNTVSEGTVNAVHREFPEMSGLSDLIQHDAEIWHGNSGGPLINLKGQVIGVNTAGIGSSAMGTEDTGAASMAFAVEGNTVCKTAAALLNGEKIVWPYMGIQGEDAKDGQQVVDVVDGGPAADAGLQVGDVITALDNQKIDRQHGLVDMLFTHQPGDVVTVTVERDGATKDFQVTLGERPASTD